MSQKTLNKPSGIDKTSFDSREFDPISYINSKFPDENSLVSLDSEIDTLKKDLAELNNELISSIHEHALLNSELQNEIVKSNSTTMSIISEVATIKEKAEKSENLVYEMCKDIKSLDIAKKNLTFSITALKKFIMMLTAIDKLREYCEMRKYKDVANLLSAFDELSSYFKKYENVSQITELYKEKDAIIRELKLQVEEDFITFTKGSSALKPQSLSEACDVVEVLGPSFKNDIVRKICGLILKPYSETFQTNENSSLENTERRYGWLLRSLKEFESQNGTIFPEYWGMICNIIYEFCGITRIQITNMLEKKAMSSDTDVAVLMKALQSTLKFEAKVQEDMKKQYSVYLQEYQRYCEEEKDNKDNKDRFMKLQVKNGEKKVKVEFVITMLPKFKGSISDSFEPYLRPYVDKEEQELFDNIRKSLVNDDIDYSSDLKVLNSSLYLFNYIKTVLKRASQYSRSQTMFDIYRVIKKALKLYNDQLGEKIMREYMKGKTDEQGFESMLCFIINTAEYCKDTLPGLCDSIKQSLESPFNDKIELNFEEELFVGLLNKGIENLLLSLDNRLEFEFGNMLKTNWEKLEKVGDISDYVKGIKILLEKHLKNVKNYLSDMYFIFYLNKIVVLINNKFINNIYKCKKIGDIGLQQLQLDIFEIKTDMIQLSKGENDKAVTSFTNFVNKTMVKSENILKLLAMNRDKFVENFRKFYEEASNADIEKIIALKGLKRNDVPTIFK